jgi:hypothetical protein
MTAPDRALEALAADFNGSCAFARPGHAADRYRIELTARGDAPVHDSADFSNRIGTVAAGTRLAGEGPLVLGQGGVTGFGVVVRDSEGLVCRGYVSSTDVKRARGRSR